LRAFDDRVFRETDGHLALFAYGNPAIRNLIRAWKYDFDQSGFSTLMKLAEPGHSTIRTFIDKAVIIPIPLSDLRTRERGFNQAVVLGEWVAEVSGSEMRELLKRGEAKGHQAERTEEERKRAMEKSPFLLKGGKVPEKIVLVDDVWTTGSTMRAAERTLKEGGVKEVKFLTIAKG
jgi:competence protein ComFC